MPDFSQLTDRQREIYDFIRSKIESRGYGPTVREIGLAFGIKSPNGVMCHLKALEKKGMITRERHMSRAIQLSAEPRGLRLAGAGLDVASREPLPSDDPLWDAPNLIITPHCSGVSQQTSELVWTIFRDNLARFVAGQPLTKALVKQLCHEPSHFFRPWGSPFTPLSLDLSTYLESPVPVGG